MAQRPVLNVAVVATADSGHMGPMMQLAESMAKRGHKVQVFTFAFGAGKYEKKVQNFGGEFVGLPCKHTEVEMFAIAKERDQFPMVFMHELMKPELTKALKGKKLDIVLADFTTLAAFEVAEEMNVPLVMNLPGPLQLAKEMLGAPDMTKPFSFAGFHLFVTPFSMPSVATIFNISDLGTFRGIFRKYITRSLVLCNSFLGMEVPQPIPTHVLLTGPLNGAEEPKPLAETHPELEAFMKSSVEAGFKVVYVTTGSMVQLEQWMIETIFNAMKLAGCRVIWSLKETQQAWLPKKDDPQFFVSSWLPQLALLVSDNVHAVVTHCGWGGTLECISGAKPVIAVPFFGDQPMNAKMLVTAGAAELLGPLPTFSVEPTGKGCYKHDSIKAEAAAGVIKQVLEDGKYLAAAKRLQGLSTAYGLGCEHVCGHIESAARHGVAHLVDERQGLMLTSHSPAILSAGLALFVGAVALGVRLRMR